MPRRYSRELSFTPPHHPDQEERPRSLAPNLLPTSPKLGESSPVRLPARRPLPCASISRWQTRQAMTRAPPKTLAPPGPEPGAPKAPTANRSPSTSTATTSRSRTPRRSSSRPAARPSSTSSATTWPSARGRCAASAPADRAQAVPRRRRGRVVLPEARCRRRRPEWLETVTVTFPSGRSAEELCPVDVAHIAWAANLGCLDLNPWPVRRATSTIPTSCASTSIPQPGVAFDVVRQVALEAREVLDEHGLAGFPKTSGSRGIHVERADRPRLGLHRGAPGGPGPRPRARAAAARRWPPRPGGRRSAASGCFVDYNQNARDRTVASAYSVRANPEGRVSCPLEWDEVPDVDPADLTLATVPARFAERGDPGAADRRPAVRPRGRCSSWRPGTRPEGSATRRGRRTSPSKRGSRIGQPPAGATGKRTDLRSRRRSPKVRRDPQKQALLAQVSEACRHGPKGRTG